MRRLAALLIIVSFMAILSAGGESPGGQQWALVSLSFGFVLLGAYLFGDMLSWARFPKITGYIIAGILAGPFVSNFLTAATLEDLKLFDNLALAFIALSAGGELELARLRHRWKTLGISVLFQVIGVFAGVFALIFLGGRFIPFLNNAPMPVVLGAAAVIGVLAIARSPSSAIAIISESRAKGPFTETTLGVTVIIDVLAIALFAATVSLTQAMVRPELTINVLFLVTVGMELIGSVAAGTALGWIVAFYIQRVGTEIPVFILAVAFLVTFFSNQFAEFLDRFYEVRFHFEPMLICMTAGFYIRNYTQIGAFFLERLDRLSLPVYVLFFALIGAALDLRMLGQTWAVAVLLALGRGFFIWASAWLSGRISKNPPVFLQMEGLSYIAQAGVSLGLCGILAKSFPDWGPEAAVTVVAMIAINQFVGPITYQYALEKVGEARHRRRGR